MEDILSIISIVAASLAVSLICGIGLIVFSRLCKEPAVSIVFGIGPKLISKRIGKTVYSLSLLPLGAYLRIPCLAEIESRNIFFVEQTFPLSRQEKELIEDFKHHMSGKLKLLSMSLGGILFNLLSVSLIFILVAKFCGFPFIEALLDIEPTHAARFEIPIPHDFNLTRINGKKVSGLGGLTELYSSETQEYYFEFRKGDRVVSKKIRPRIIPIEFIGSIVSDEKEAKNIQSGESERKVVMYVPQKASPEVVFSELEGTKHDASTIGYKLRFFLDVVKASALIIIINLLPIVPLPGGTALALCIQRFGAKEEA